MKEKPDKGSSNTRVLFECVFNDESNNILRLGTSLMVFVISYSQFVAIGGNCQIQEKEE
jgi:hypothetical protein